MQSSKMPVKTQAAMTRLWTNTTAPGTEWHLEWKKRPAVGVTLYRRGDQMSDFF